MRSSLAALYKSPLFPEECQDQRNNDLHAACYAALVDSKLVFDGTAMLAARLPDGKLQEREPFHPFVFLEGRFDFAETLIVAHWVTCGDIEKKRTHVPRPLWQAQELGTFGKGIGHVV